MLGLSLVLKSFQRFIRKWIQVCHSKISKKRNSIFTPLGLRPQGTLSTKTISWFFSTLFNLKGDSKLFSQIFPKTNFGFTKFWRLCFALPGNVFNLATKRIQKMVKKCYFKTLISHSAARLPGNVVTTSFCTSQRRRRYLSIETPNDVSVELRQDVSEVRLHDVCFHWFVVTTSQGDAMTTPHQYVFTTSQISLKWNIQWHLSSTSLRRLL